MSTCACAERCSGDKTDFRALLDVAEALHVTHGGQNAVFHAWWAVAISLLLVMVVLQAVICSRVLELT